MKIIIVLISVLVLSRTSSGSSIGGPTYRNMFERADLVTIAQLISSKETPELTTLPSINLRNIASPIPVVGVESKFSTQIILKGNKSINEFVLHHYKEDKPRNSRNEPYLVSFPIQGNRLYLLFLNQAPDSRYHSIDEHIINSQIIPGVSGIKPADQIDFIVIANPISEKVMKETRTQNTISKNGSKTSQEKVVVKYQTEFSVIQNIKGESNTKTFVFQHYEYKESVHSGGLETNFIPRKQSHYLLLLKTKLGGHSKRTYEPLDINRSVRSSEFPVIEMFYKYPILE